MATSMPAEARLHPAALAEDGAVVGEGTAAGHHAHVRDLRPRAHAANWQVTPTRVRSR